MTQNKFTYPVSLALVLVFSAAVWSQNDARFDAATEYSRSTRGAALLIIEKGKTVVEEYPIGGSPELPWFLASGTKSFAGVMCAAAIDDGLIGSFDEKVSDTITEWRSDEKRSSITIRQLLTLTSGIDAGPVASSPSYRSAISYEQRHDPGTKFQYGPVPFQVFGELMTRKLSKRNETVMAYLERRILDPLGIKGLRWRKVDGQPILAQGIAMTAREWSQFGKFLVAGGKWNGKQLIKKKLIDELVKGSAANPAYGITFWLNGVGVGPAGDIRSMYIDATNKKKTPLAGDVFMAAGAGNQRLYMIPSLDLVIVRFGIFGGFDDGVFLRHIAAVYEKPKK